MARARSVSSRLRPVRVVGAVAGAVAKSVVVACIVAFCVVCGRAGEARGRVRRRWCVWVRSYVRRARVDVVALCLVALCLVVYVVVVCGL